MSVTTEEWAVQVSVKHGPLDERGNPLYMTNIRGATAAQVQAHLSELAAFGPDIQDALNQFVAVGNLGTAGFMLAPAAAPTPAISTTTAQTPASLPTDATSVTVCPVNSNARHRYKTGTKKDGKQWRAIMCSNNPECEVQWLRD